MVNDKSQVQGLVKRLILQRLGSSPISPLEEQLLPCRGGDGPSQLDTCQWREVTLGVVRLPTTLINSLSKCTPTGHKPWQHVTAPAVFQILATYEAMQDSKSPFKIQACLQLRMFSGQFITLAFSLIVMDVVVAAQCRKAICSKVTCQTTWRASSVSHFCC